jgi:hypothetical protein
MWYDPVFLVNTVYARHVVQKALGRFLSLSINDAIERKLKRIEIEALPIVNAASLLKFVPNEYVKQQL